MLNNVFGWQLDFDYERRQKMIKEWQDRADELIARNKHLTQNGFPKQEKKERKNDPRI